MANNTLPQNPAKAAREPNLCALPSDGPGRADRQEATSGAHAARRLVNSHDALLAAARECSAARVTNFVYLRTRILAACGIYDLESAD